ncbi:transglutaminase [Epidermidibacterium keratini]|uniref:Transglutaminase n=1 Tax=Epidermidibacterium keratini TaxID=1891644 RepID=A0A7L4YQI6_9ACTN|nr:transglutaminase family protein [Epidermidibacterium keratini]QHC01203.1 transglutaminase [Epidermidibacterium keratini]
MSQISTVPALDEAPGRQSLEPTDFLDSDYPSVVEYAATTCEAAGAHSDRDKAVALFNAVRDGWRYDPYVVSRDVSDYRASAILASESSWCVPKSVLLTALCRAAGIPAGLGFADVRNHLQSSKLEERMGTDLFVFHGYSAIWIDGAWRKASSAFNRELCERFGTKVLEFDGVNDALMHPFDEAGNRHMEYVRYRGDVTDLPLGEILAEFDEVYGAGFAGGSDGVRDQAFGRD